MILYEHASKFVSINDGVAHILYIQRHSYMIYVQMVCTPSRNKRGREIEREMERDREDKKETNQMAYSHTDTDHLSNTPHSHT